MSIDKTIFLMWATWYFYTYGPPPILNYFFCNIYFYLNDMIHNFNYVIFPDFWENSDTGSEQNNNDEISTDDTAPPPKYEDKYLKDIRNLNKDWNFSEEELKSKILTAKDFFNASVENINTRINEIEKEVVSIEKEIAEDKNEVQFTETYDGEGDEVINEITLEDRNEYRREQIKQLQEEYNKLKISISTDNGIQELKENADKQAHEYIANKRIEKLKNSYIMERTPQGNVLMIYNNDRGSFSYYSDATIPYRYLEVVGRKYVKVLDCRPLFVDMEEELKLFEEKWTKEYELKKAKEAEEKLKAEEAVRNNKPVEVKKNVFAKFKSYNKDAGGKISMAPPPKNSIPSKTTETKEDEKIILKERANRYTYEGKFANFNFLQKIERKVFNKKLGLSFADFKKFQQKQ